MIKSNTFVILFCTTIPLSALAQSTDASSKYKELTETITEVSTITEQAVFFDGTGKIRQLSFPKFCILNYSERSFNKDGNESLEEGFTVPVHSLSAQDIEIEGEHLRMRSKERLKVFEHYIKVYEFPPILGDVDEQKRVLVGAGGSCNQDFCTQPSKMRNGSLTHMPKKNLDSIKRALGELISLCSNHSNSQSL